MNHRQEWSMLTRRLAYPGGRKARRAERRIQRLIRQARGIILQVVGEMNSVGRRLLRRMGQCAPQVRSVPTEGK